MKKLRSTLTTSYQSELKQIVYLDVRDHQDDQPSQTAGDIKRGGTGSLTSSATIRKLGDVPSDIINLHLYEGVKLVVSSGQAFFDPAEDEIMTDEVYEELIEQALHNFGVSADDIIVESRKKDIPMPREQKVISLIEKLQK